MTEAERQAAAVYRSVAKRCREKIDFTRSMIYTSGYIQALNEIEVWCLAAAERIEKEERPDPSTPVGGA